MRATALFAALLVLPSALALALPAFDHSYGNFYQLGGLKQGSIQHREPVPNAKKEVEKEVEKLDLDQQHADHLEKAKEADERVAFENVQFEDNKFDSTKLAVTESEEPRRKKVTLQLVLLEKGDLLKFDSDQDGVLGAAELEQKKKLEHEQAAELKQKTSKEKDIDFENVQFQKVKFDSTKIKVKEHTDEKLTMEGKKTEKVEAKGAYQKRQ
ncbi:hypothetical protein JCM21900_006944 [Sporobolomyces salmonicolor]